MKTIARALFRYRNGGLKSVAQTSWLVSFGHQFSIFCRHFYDCWSGLVWGQCLRSYYFKSEGDKRSGLLHANYNRIWYHRCQIVFVLLVLWGMFLCIGYRPSMAFNGHWTHAPTVKFSKQNELYVIPNWCCCLAWASSSKFKLYNLSYRLSKIPNFSNRKLL